MKTLLGAAAVVAASVSATAEAATIVQNFGGPGGFSVAKFDPSLGTLNSIVANVTGGFATYLVEVNGPLNGSTSYTGSAYFGIYLGPLTIDGNVQNASTATFVQGQAQITLPVVPYVDNIGVPTDPNSAAYNALIGLGNTPASLTVDPPFNISFGNLSGFSVNAITLQAKSAIWSLTYDYTPFGAIVPEPATWAMMILGFALVGGAVRRRRATVGVRFA